MVAGLHSHGNRNEKGPHDGVWDDVRAMLKKRGIALRAMAGE
jgi:L-rhamnose mutarotase